MVTPYTFSRYSRISGLLYFGEHLNTKVFLGSFMLCRRTIVSYMFGNMYLAADAMIIALDAASALSLVGLLVALVISNEANCGSSIWTPDSRIAIGAYFGCHLNRCFTSALAAHTCCCATYPFGIWRRLWMVYLHQATSSEFLDFTTVGQQDPPHFLFCNGQPEKSA